MTETCFVCGYAVEQNLETHHIVPRRFGGSDEPENLVTLCPTCHKSIERIHDKRFYEALGVYRSIEDTTDDTDPVIDSVRNVVEYIVRTQSSVGTHLSENGRDTIHVLLSEFGLTGQFCYSCGTFFNTRFDTDDQCPSCKGIGFKRVAQ